MNTVWALWTAETRKARRAAPARLAVAAPALLFVLQLLTMFSRHTINATKPAALWTDLVSFGWVMWLGLFLPALIVFEAISLAGMEHDGRHWKQLFALPVPRWQVFVVKMLFCGALVGASFAVFAATSVGAVWLFSAARGLHLAAWTPWAEIFSIAARAFLACWVLIVAHTWLSVRFPGFAVPAGVGFAAMLVGVFLVGADPAAFGWWYPWTLAINVRPQGLYEAHDTLAPALFGAAAGVVLAPIASWDLGRRALG